MEKKQTFFITEACTKEGAHYQVCDADWNIVHDNIETYAEAEEIIRFMGERHEITICTCPMCSPVGANQLPSSVYGS